MNLKTAARRLGVHYQTAYKWVRSGALVAVKVGLGYEISEAALARFQAQREALGRAPRSVDLGAVGAPDDKEAVLAEIDRMVSRVTIDARAVFETVARRAAEVLGDSVAVRVVSDDGMWLQTVAFYNPDPVHYVILGTVLGSGMQRVDQGFAASVLATGEGLFIPHVPQDRARATVIPEYHQFLDDVGIHSLIMLPIVVDGLPVGTLSVSRDAPGHPYLDEDRELATELAARAGAALHNARRFAQGWQARADVKERIEAVIATGRTIVRDDDGMALPAEELLGDLFFESNLGIALLDLEGRCLAASPRFVDILGSDDDTFGRDAYGSTPDAGACAACLARLVSGEIDFADCDRTVTRPDGAPVHLVVHRSVARAPDATPHCVIDVVHEELRLPPGLAVACSHAAAAGGGAG